MPLYDSKWDRKSTAQKIEAVQDELERDIAQWHSIYENGCSDPFWPDGVNLELCRNHIINDLRMLSELNEQPMQLSLFALQMDGTAGADYMSDPRIPPVVPQDYMAKERQCQYFVGRR